VTATIAELDPEVRTLIVRRLKSIEGQARGIQRMVEDQRSCQEIMDQIAAMRAASHALSIQLLEEFALHCLRSANDSPSLEQAVAQMVSVVSKLTR
jgi:CsoR family transcriptional regulator, copper-sensing transcriptional repressor